MVPPKNHSQWSSLVAGRVDCKFGNTAASMLLARLQNDIKADSTPGAMVNATDEMHAFFVKYERMMEQKIRAIFD